MTTTTVSLHQSDPRRLRRYLAASLAGVAFLAAAAVVANRAIDDESPRAVPAVAAVPATLAIPALTKEEAADMAMVHNAIPVFTAPDFAPPASEMQLVIDEDAWSACGVGVTEMCPFTHTWI